jgi:squalene-hopene/tetraprenyl-beta-curcumene cyclase
MRALALLCLTPALFAQETAVWSPQSAAHYLDARLQWWSTWPNAARDHQTFCVSCHTTLPYAAARSSLRTALGEKSPAPIEQKLLDNVIVRVRAWDETGPYYPNKNQTDTKTIESRGTESILNAFVLTNYPASEDSQRALDHMWAMQLTSGDDKGAWPWLQFHNAPWEGDSQYFGTAIAAIAAGRAHSSHPGIAPMKEYLRKDLASRTLLDRLMLLWASAKIEGLLTPAERERIITDIMAQQHPDGGFTLSSFVGGWKRKDNSPLETASDGYATGLTTFVLREAGVPQSEAHLESSLHWLATNQRREDGRWLAWSLNKQRDLDTDIGKFMSDAATAYAVLALERR